MNKVAVLLTLAFILTPCVSGAVSDQDFQYAREIGQRWVDLHNAKLGDLVKKAAEMVSPKKKGLVVPSFHPPELAKKSLKLEDAESFGIPAQTTASDGVTVDLMNLYRTPIEFSSGGEYVFITAEYFDDLNPLHSSSDIYMKIGDKYYKFFHGEGYRGCAKIIFMDQSENDAPVFFDIGIYGGGSQVQKTLYGLDKAAVSAIPQTLFDSPEKIRIGDYIREKLAWTVWLAGQTFYRDLAQDGVIDILNLTQAPYPLELKAKLHEKYGFVNTDFIKSFRTMLSVYQWNDPQQQFDDIGDYYY